LLRLRDFPIFRLNRRAALHAIYEPQLH
jgi:hypothetical protein